ncbi:hypothetical protein C8R43DRAFT_1240277 [Mycena crocata]|nr:hypothetical protein C8R43DRAFT_1240277 [Mycena crocata]
MPTPVVQTVPTWIANLRWLFAFLKLQKLPAVLRSILWRLRRALSFNPTNHDSRKEETKSSDCIPDQTIQILPSEQPEGFDAAFPKVSGKKASEDSDATAVNDAQLGRPPVVTQPGTSVEGSETTSTPMCHPMFPDNFARYDIRETIPRGKAQPSIDPETFKFASVVPPADWSTRLHPEGARYFYHPERRIFTDLNLCERQNFTNLNHVLERLIDNIRTSGKDTDPHYATLLGGTPHQDLFVDLVIDMAPSEDKPEDGYYYFINHTDRCPFWAEPISTELLRMLDNIEGAIDVKNEQFKHAMEEQYWHHCTMFPDAFGLTQQHINELEDRIVYSIGDVTTSLTSTVFRSVEELGNWLSVVRHLQCDDSSPGSVFTFARLMGEFAYERFLYFHGLPCARLSQTQSVYDAKKHTPSHLLTFMSPLLFFAPGVYLQLLEKAYVDQTVLARVWKPLIHKLNTEWEDFTLLATVLLNANVGFLAINSVDIPTLDGRHSLIQIASYFSTVASIGSMILGLLLVRQNRTKFHESAGDIAASVHRRTSKIFGLELLAVIFSLPYALLMWSMIFFFGALLATCLKAETTVPDLAVVGVAAIVVLLVLWCVWDAWDMQAANKPPFMYTLKKRIQSAFRTIVSLAAPSSIEEKAQQPHDQHQEQEKRPSFRAGNDAAAQVDTNQSNSTNDA